VSSREGSVVIYISRLFYIVSASSAYILVNPLRVVTTLGISCVFY
jgi:hypothetical protein